MASKLLLLLFKVSIEAVVAVDVVDVDVDGETVHSVGGAGHFSGTISDRLYLRSSAEIGCIGDDTLDASRR